MSAAVKIVKTLKTPSEAGEYFRLVCMTGKNKGFVYYLNDNRVVLGRSDKCDIQVWDNKSSREHAELTKVENHYFVTDLGSQNGIVINDEKVKQQALKSGDLIIIGQTVYKFNHFEIEKKNLALVREEQEEEEVVDIFADPPKQEKKVEKKEPNKRILIYGLVGLLLYWVLSEEDSKPKKRTPKRSSVNTTSGFDDIIKGQQTKRDKVLDRKVSAYIHRGQREYREENFFRAIEQFNLALILDPQNSHASFYLSRSKQRLDEKIKEMEIKAERELSGIRYKASLISFCAVLSYLRKYPEDKRYLNAKKQVDVLLDRLDMDKNEYKCF